MSSKRVQLFTSASEPSDMSDISPTALDLHESATKSWIVGDSNQLVGEIDTTANAIFYVTIVNASPSILHLKLPFANMPTQVKPWSSTWFWRYGAVGRVYTLSFTKEDFTHTAAIGHSSEGTNWARWNTNEPRRFNRWKSYYPEKGMTLTVTFVVA
ncbi:hypothetical protein OPQ81_011132 [Rhizoctonia solani]|nr:hypothetical protein OPQ81_011132 [Rhizoctonia solani]